MLLFLAGLVLHVGATDELSERTAAASPSKIVLETGGDGDGTPDPICTAAHQSLHDGFVGSSASTDPDMIGPAGLESEINESPVERTARQLPTESLYATPVRLSELCISRT
ncbi:hypothetical protein [Pseudonocardia sp. ICBG162]|uniref:hypothetical protein n=1 Tax=Pseudonocardia sp. ICBG162 TaxID=2846761 RepID=UPI001CF68179|nr:hypothetical protein [Pseudonocardia sp. ICBG162]